MKDNSQYEVVGQEFAALQLPLIRDVRGKEWIYYGEENLYPQVLIDLYNNSAMHHTCVQAIKDGIIGEGIEIIGDEVVNKHGETVDEVFEKISQDYVIFGGYAVNTVWNREGTKIVEMYHLPFNNVRSGKLDEEDNVTHYYYTNHWENVRKYPAHSYRAFDPLDNRGDNASQVYYCYNYAPGNDYYPLPDYVGGVNDIQLDGRISKFHNANISNGLSPSLFIQFRNGIPTPEARRDIYNEIQDTFAGEDKAGRFFLSFSDPGKEMQVTPITSANDQYYITLEERVSSRILTAHRITSPLLLGIKDASGFSNNADEIRVSYDHFEATVVQPKRKKVLTTYGYLLRFMGWNITLTIKPNRILIQDLNVNEEETQDATVPAQIIE
jgi:hypothetical protein